MTIATAVLVFADRSVSGVGQVCDPKHSGTSVQRLRGTHDMLFRSVALSAAIVACLIGVAAPSYVEIFAFVSLVLVVLAVTSPFAAARLERFAEPGVSLPALKFFKPLVLPPPLSKPAPRSTVPVAPSSSGPHPPPSKNSVPPDTSPIPDSQLAPQLQPAHIKAFYNVFDSRLFQNGKFWLDSVHRGDVAYAMTFSAHAPTSNVEHGGFNLSNNTLTGPACHSLGMDSDSGYSIAFSAKVMPVLDHLLGEIDVLHLYANTSNNNGLRISIDDVVQDVKDTLVVKCRFRVYVGSRPEAYASEQVQLLVHNMYTFFVVKHPGRIIVMYMSDNPHESYLRTVIDANVGNEVVQFSNKALDLNASGKLTWCVYAFAMWNTPLPPSAVVGVHEHVAGKRAASSPERQKLAQERSELMSKIEHMRRCPMEDAACKKCHDVVDWASPLAMMGASDMCTSAVVEWCETTPNHSMCVCWDPMNPASQSDYCKDQRLRVKPPPPPPIPANDEVVVPQEQDSIAPKPIEQQPAAMPSGSSPTIGTVFDKNLVRSIEDAVVKLKHLSQDLPVVTSSGDEA